MGVFFGSRAGGRVDFFVIGVSHSDFFFKRIELSNRIIIARLVRFLLVSLQYLIFSAVRTQYLY